MKLNLSETCNFVNVDHDAMLQSVVQVIIIVLQENHAPETEGAKDPSV